MGDCVIPGAGDEVAEVSEDEPARANVKGCATEEPQGDPPAADDDERYVKKRPPALQGDKSAEHQERHGVHQQMAQVGVEKRAQRDAAQSR